MLVNTPVLQANLADNINTASSRNASSVDKMIAIGSIGADLTPAGGGSRIAKNAIKSKVATKASKQVATQAHHIIPKYLGGATKALRAMLPTEYHQLITNAFRTEVAYGSPEAIRLRNLAKNNPSEWLSRIKKITDKIYGELPIDDFERLIK